MSQVRILSVVLGTSVVLAACGTDGGGTDAATQRAIALSETSTGSSVDASVNQEIDITLQTVGPGEYVMPSISSDSVRFLELSSPAVQNPGGIKQDFRFQADSGGTAVVTISHTVKTEPFEVTIVVR